MGVKELLAKWRSQKEEGKAIERQQRNIELMQEKKLSSDERELERFQKQEYDKKVKAALEQFRQRDNDRVWRGQEGNPLYTQNVVAGHKRLFGNDTNIFRSHKPTKQKCIFFR